MATIKNKGRARQTEYNATKVWHIAIKHYRNIAIRRYCYIVLILYGNIAIIQIIIYIFAAATINVPFKLCNL